jgi:hypothetical protein
MRENRTYGSEAGEAQAFPTPIAVGLGRDPKKYLSPARASIAAFDGLALARRRAWPGQARP